MDLEPIRRYFEDNIRKGYTIEQISTNLKNNNYSEETIQQAIQLLGPQHKELSQQNPQKFDYSKLPQNVKQHIEQKVIQPSQTQNVKQKTTIERHPGLDQKSLIMYGGIIGGILLIIVIGAFLFSGANEEGVVKNDFSSNNQLTGTDNTESRNSFSGSEETETPSVELNDTVKEKNESCTTYSCLADAAKQCTKTEGSIDVSITIMGVTSNVSTLEKIIPITGACVYSSEINDVSVTLGENQKNQLKEQLNYTDAEILEFEQNVSKKSIEQAGGKLNTPLLCKFENSADLVQLLREANSLNTSNVAVCDFNESDKDVLRMLGVSDEAIQYHENQETCVTFGTYNKAICLIQNSSKTIEEQFSGKTTYSESAENIEYQDIVGQYCQQDSDCDDGNIQTKNWCGSDNTCRTGLGDPNSCEDNDGFCPESCYGTGDSDCVDALGRILCSKNEHCDDDNNLTEDLCDDKKGYCIYFDVEPENHMPEFTSEPELQAIVGEEYEYKITVKDKDDDNITLTLENAPSSMSINDSVLTWTPEKDEFSETFTIIASDGKDEAEQEIKLMIYLKEEDDTYRDSCGTDQGCYLNAVIFSEEAYRCKYLAKYWDDPNNEQVDDCIFTVAQNIGDTSVCAYITNEDTRKSCENI